MKLSFIKRKPKLPTDLEILECIYNEYYQEFTSFVKGKRAAKVYVPINFDLIGEKMEVDGDIPFGRVYLFLNDKYSLQAKPESPLFVLNIGEESLRNVNCIHFPFMAAILAELKSEREKHLVQVRIGWISLAISFLAILVAVAVALWQGYQGPTGK